MDNAAVVAALMPAHALFFFQQQQAKLRESARDFERHRKAYNASAHNDDVVPRIGHKTPNYPHDERNRCPLAWLIPAGKPDYSDGVSYR